MWKTCGEKEGNEVSKLVEDLCFAAPSAHRLNAVAGKEAKLGARRVLGVELLLMDGEMSEGEREKERKNFEK